MLERSDLGQQLDEITEWINERNYRAALKALEQIPVSERTPWLTSAYALCLAEVKGASKNVVNLCHEAIKQDPKNPEHYYRQGRILIRAGRKKDSIWVLRMGLRHGRHKGIIDILGSLGLRRAPPLTFLARDNPFNKYLGLFLGRLNLR